MPRTRSTGLRITNSASSFIPVALGALLTKLCTAIYSEITNNPAIHFVVLFKAAKHVILPAVSAMKIVLNCDLEHYLLSNKAFILDDLELFRDRASKNFN